MAASVKRSKRLVIDASVARAAGGEDTDSPTAKYCRDFLKAVLKICHHVVMSPEISEEWKRHQSRFTRGWRVAMEARKKVYYIEAAFHPGLHEKIERVLPLVKKSEFEAMRKDFLLIEAALVTDKIVVSRDDTVRRLFSLAAPSVGELRSIAWVNPEKEEETLIPWLEKGAKSERERLLSSRPKAQQQS